MSRSTDMLRERNNLGCLECLRYFATHLRAWIRRMCARPSLSGNENSTRRSRRPGRRSAGSRVSGLSYTSEAIIKWCQSFSLPICSHQHLDVPSRIEPIQLIDKLQHCSLHLIVSACTIIESGAADRVHLIEEDYTRFLRACHFE